MRNRGDNIYAIEAKQMEPHLWHSINKMQTYVNVTRFLGQFQSIYYQDLEFFRDLFIYLSIFSIRFDNLVHHAYLSLFTFYGTSLTREFTNSPRRFLRFHVKDYVNIQIKKYTK